MKVEELQEEDEPRVKDFKFEAFEEALIGGGIIDEDLDVAKPQFHDGPVLIDVDGEFEDHEVNDPEVEEIIA